MYVPRLRYSLTMSFCVVPRSRCAATPDPRRGRRRDRASRPAVALIVIDVFISLDRDLVEQLAHVAQVHDGDANLADLAPGQRVVGVVARLGREVERDRQAGLAFGQVRAVELVRLAWPWSAPSTSASTRAGRPSTSLSPEVRAGQEERGVGGGSTERGAQGVRGSGVSRSRWHPGSARWRRAPLHVEQSKAPLDRNISTSPTSATFDASLRWWNIDSPAKRPPMATP